MLDFSGREDDDLSPVDPSKPSRDDVYMTTEELSERWRLDKNTLANLRWNGEGPPFVKVTGTVLYKVTDILALEAEKTQGFRWQDLRAALESFAGLSGVTRKELMMHMKRTMK